ncbi:MAG TPA: TolC family protein, partial [Candidatus Kapabacteria bacterium]|nr:TolC family protein [Candidatus Kapabacteria bacterium]
MLFIIFILFDGIKSFALEILTLEDAVNIGLKNNYAIQLSKNELQISKENNTYGNSDMLPSINLNAGTDLSFKNNYFEYSNDSTSNSSTASVKNYNLGLALNWTLFDGFKMFTTKQKLEEIEKAGEINYKIQLQQSIADIIDAYYDIVKQKQLLNNFREIKELSKE